MLGHWRTRDPRASVHAVSRPMCRKLTTEPTPGLSLSDPICWPQQRIRDGQFGVREPVSVLAPNISTYYCVIKICNSTRMLRGIPLRITSEGAICWWWAITMTPGFLRDERDGACVLFLTGIYGNRDVNSWVISNTINMSVTPKYRACCTVCNLDINIVKICNTYLL